MKKIIEDLIADTQKDLENQKAYVESMQEELRGYQNDLNSFMVGKTLLALYDLVQSEEMPNLVRCLVSGGLDELFCDGELPLVEELSKELSAWGVNLREEKPNN